MIKKHAIEIIILILILSTVIAGGLVFNHYKFEKPNTYDIIFKDIDSIVKGSPVRFMGINVGHVVKLKRKDGYIICKIRITKKHVKIPNSTRAKVAFNGLGGSKSVELTPPIANDNDLRGIIADESLRINDFGGMLRTLTEVSVFINNFVHQLDTDAIMGTLKAYTNPNGLDKADNSLQHAAEYQRKMLNEAKSAAKQESVFSNLIDFINLNIQKFLGGR